MAVLVGLLGASVAVAWRRPWRVEYGPKWQWICMFCLVVAWDDALEHTFGFWMPLDWLWKAHLMDILL